MEVQRFSLEPPGLPAGCAGWARNPKGPKTNLFATKWVAVPPFWTWRPRPDAELRRGSD